VSLFNQGQKVVGMGANQELFMLEQDFLKRWSDYKKSETTVFQPLSSKNFSRLR
jgi:hypothetical protein